ncbi:hypothetical protein [Halorientalis pallida]|uniref:Uncharacterized protein n=1 Tax=Halorientalis pallida TaxID=2479928 RepID=A0A498L1G5_9EURY|nr:hypothetical protein [Halorientalis pallida]RXK51826.1 hypothetical protein EAF64_04115 [Halorientalis pallida]
MRLGRVVTLVAAVTCLAVASGAFGAADADAPTRAFIQPSDGEDRLWPYTSKRRSTDGRTLAINVLVGSNTSRAQQVLTREAAVDWERANGAEPSGDASVPLPGMDDVEVDIGSQGNLNVDGPGVHLWWAPTHGSTRYTYVDPARGRGRWVEQDFQLHAGTYLGTRQHVRGFGSPSGTWTAVQVHAEWWDWFRLRHTVTSTRGSQELVEDDLADEPGVRVRGRNFSGYGSRGAGGITVVDLLALAVPAVALAVGGGTERLRRRTLDALATGDDRLGGELRLAAAVCGLYLVVRLGGMSLETVFPWIHPKLFAAVLYPVVALGVPAMAYRQGSTVEPLRGFGVTAAALLAAFAADFAVVGVGVPGPELAQHRVGVALAAGLLAAGASARTAGAPGSRRRRIGTGLVAVAALAWLVALAVPLFGL